MECNINLPRIEHISNCGIITRKKVLIFRPTNSKKGIATVGNLRVEMVYKYNRS